MQGHIINLTQHRATQQQQADGVFEPAAEVKEQLCVLLTFKTKPFPEDIYARACHIAAIAARELEARNVENPKAMIGGALWLMSALEAALRERGIEPLYSFTQRESEELHMPDGSVQKVQVFRHIGWVEPCVQL